MAEDLSITNGTKTEQYNALIPQIKALIDGESNLIANLANIAAALSEQFNHLWIGFYLADKEDELVLGPFQGPVACTRIKHGKGVCGTSWATGEVQIVANVDDFPGHIACSSLSKSEIVLPLWNKGRIEGVLDLDSVHLNAFDEIDARYLTEIISLIPWEVHSGNARLS